MPREKAKAGVTQARLSALPLKPGVYLMKDGEGKVLYVGKAKQLRSRVRSYFNGSDERSTVPYLIERVEEISTLVTEDERQALILEADLIRQHKPRFNIRLKDDKAYLFAKIDRSHQWPKIELVRVKKDDGATYVGPFAFAYELRALKKAMQRSIPLRTCSDRMIYNRVRPCLEYQIGRCCAPCCLDIDPDYYDGLVEQAVAVLKGDTASVLQELEHDMEHASEQLRFEDAALIRDRMEILRRIYEEKAERVYGDDTIDCFALYREGEKIELSVLSVRSGRIYGSRTFGFTDVKLSEEMMLGSLITQYYEGSSELPDFIITPFELEDADTRAAWFSERRGKKLEFVCPQRGRKARVLDLAKTNAKQNFEARFSAQDKRTRILEALAAEFELAETPRTIECVDISHFQGGSTVGAIVSFKDGAPDKSRYRNFHLSQEYPDDFGSMREVMQRHLSRCAEENTLPDLVVVDGGKAQLSQCVKIRDELGLLRPAMVGLAKRRFISQHYRARARPQKASSKPERVYLEGAAEPIVLPAEHEVVRLLERLRDETHRFAITFHRKTRKKRSFSSALDAVPGIGPKRAAKLLNVFGSVERIKQQEPEELAESGGIPLSLAKRILKLLG